MSYSTEWLRMPPDVRDAYDKVRLWRCQDMGHVVPRGLFHDGEEWSAVCESCGKRWRLVEE